MTFMVVVIVSLYAGAVLYAAIRTRRRSRVRSTTIWVVTCPEIKVPALLALQFPVVGRNRHPRLQECSLGLQSAGCAKGCLRSIEPEGAESPAWAKG